ncbi:hypothetical protein CIHG_03451 [Coccidioides immitis H538.4]|uniref:Uncharacterized protein n=2 Tax=Coccidioides immitis TaxID=5501 RepID=A0A0J8U3Q0_COCIT|nr:hypothetical protein CISG_09038 [Coccidioides immitis RMSCC 3703]KMU85922.1 hypothetical protein CIHG_03451 [Coccidioides immitis H538.4]
MSRGRIRHPQQQLRRQNQQLHPSHQPRRLNQQLHPSHQLRRLNQQLRQNQQLHPSHQLRRLNQQLHPSHQLRRLNQQLRQNQHLLPSHQLRRQNQHLRHQSHQCNRKKALNQQQARAVRENNTLLVHVAKIRTVFLDAVASIPAYAKHLLTRNVLGDADVGIRSPIGQLACCTMKPLLPLLDKQRTHGWMG